MPASVLHFKDPSWIFLWLDTALNKEKEKYKKCPVLPDAHGGYEAVQGWGYVVLGYFIVEEALKALLYFRKKDVPQVHGLSTLFDLLVQDDKSVLREYYDDYMATIGGRLGRFTFRCIGDFLVNLDGDKNGRGNYIGSFDWRYFLIEKMRSEKMPFVSVDYLHEVAYGAIRIVDWIVHKTSPPSQHTHSWRLYCKREEKYSQWYDVRMGSDGWDELGDRVESLWGPDYLGRYDLYIFEGNTIKPTFSELPTDLKLRILDKRKELEDYSM